MPDIWQTALDQMVNRMDAMGPQLRGAFPHYADPVRGEWTTTPDGDWTGGFWPGMCWLAAKSTGGARYRRWAGEWVERLRPRAASDTAFRGFLFYYGAVLGDVLFRDPKARAIALEAARQWVKTYNLNAGCFPLGTAAEEASDVGPGEASVDTVQGAALLVWAAAATNEPAWRNLAVFHARRHIEFCIRADGSVCQSASFDPLTGALKRRYTHKGFTDESTWARAQAWAILGYALMHQWTGEADFLEVAQRTADWWIAHVPVGRVAYWDFDAPVTPDTEHDTSATAITAAALLKLAAAVKNEQKRKEYRAAAEATARALVEGYLDARGILDRGCYSKRSNLATRNELIWGSYYLFEALHVLAAKLEPAKI
jgi:unsaturated chondroitin disaccharide hydrolase